MANPNPGSVSAEALPAVREEQKQVLWQKQVSVPVTHQKPKTYAQCIPIYATFCVDSESAIRKTTALPNREIKLKYGFRGFDMTEPATLPAITRTQSVVPHMTQKCSYISNTLSKLSKLPGFARYNIKFTSLPSESVSNLKYVWEGVSSTQNYTHPSPKRD